MLKGVCFLLVVFCFGLPAIGGSQGERELIKGKLSRPELRHVRPVRDPNDPVNVKHGLGIQNIVALDLNEHTVTIIAWNDLRWKSHYLKWKPGAFQNITSVLLPADEIWVPDVVLSNELDVAQPSDAGNALVSNDGSVVYTTRSAFKVRCKLASRHMHCRFKFMSWMHDGFKLDLEPLSVDNLDMSNFQDGDMFKMSNTSVVREVVYYACCVEPYPHIDYSFNIGYL